LLSSSGTEVDPEWEAGKSTYLNELDVRKPFGYLFQKKMKTCDSTTWFRI
jgi:hypothetical protein